MSKTFDFSWKSDADKKALCKRACDDYKNFYNCDHYGRFPWDTEPRGNQHDTCRNVSISKASLGEFMYEVLIRCGDATNFFALGYGARNSVWVRVWMTLDARDDFVENTKYILNPPPMATLSMQND